MLKILKLIKNFFFLMIITGLLGILGFLGIFIYFGSSLPDYNQLASYDPPVVTRIHAGDGRLFAEYATEKRLFVPIQSIPQHIVDTVLAVEDKHFYQHIGLDWVGLIRATLHNIVVYITGRGAVAGGSTITQQVAKNFLLHSKKTLVRKIKEAILSLRIEKAYSKDKIMELYLNEIYFGKGAYGIAAASLQYFNKSLGDLSIAEAAFLAALPKAPNNYNPKRRPKAALARRNWVLARMMEEKVITPAQAVTAKKEPITLQAHKVAEVVDAKYFAEEIRRFLKQKFGDKALYEGGLSVRTTLDSRLQKIADRALREGLITYDHRHGWHGTLQNISLSTWEAALEKINPPVGSEPWVVAVVLDAHEDHVVLGLKEGARGHIPFDTMKWARRYNRNEKGAPYLGPVLKTPADILSSGDVVLVHKASGDPLETTSGVLPRYSLEQMPLVDGALVALDPHTGRILALVGGYSYERSEFNRATQALRQAGSAFKPFTYIAALEKGYSPVSLLHDIPFVMEQGPDQGYWAPQNIEKRFFGVNTLRHALEKSFNVSLVRLANEIGMSSVIDVARRFGVYDNLPPYLAAVLGSEETTLLKFSAAYGMLVNGGKSLKPYLIDRIQNRHGKTIYKFDQRVCDECHEQPWAEQLPPELPDNRAEVTDPLTAYQVVSMLEGAAIRGTGRKVNPKGHIAGIKTGTSSDYRDTWTLGFTRDLVVGVFVGFDAPKSLGRYNTGSSVAGPIFKSFMEQALKGQPKKPFRVPPQAKFIAVTPKTGERAGAQDKRAILEVFKPNQHPNTPAMAAIAKGSSSDLQNPLVGGIY